MLMQQPATHQDCKDELARLQGQWRQVRFEEDGVVSPADSHSSARSLLTIRGTTFHVGEPGSRTLLQGDFAIRMVAGVRQIDWIDSVGVDAGKLLPAIYSVSDTEFEFAAADEGHSRPDDFQGGSGITVRGFIKLSPPPILREL